MADLSINIFDDSTLTELVGTSCSVDVDDSTTTSESLGYYTDSVGALEQLNLQIVEYQAFSTADFSTVSEFSSVSPAPNPSTQDFVNVADLIAFYPDTVFVEDFVTEVDILNPFTAKPNDLVSTSESLSITVSSAFAITNPKKIIAEVTDPQIIRIERL